MSENRYIQHQDEILDLAEIYGVPLNIAVDMEQQRYGWNDNQEEKEQFITIMAR